MNTLRQILVVGTAAAALIAATYGRWLTVTVLTAAVIIHGYLTWKLSHDAKVLAAARTDASGVAGAPPGQQH